MDSFNSAGPSRTKSSRLFTDSWLAYNIFFLLSALQAYAILSVPIQYIAAIASCWFVLFLRIKYGRLPVAHLWLLVPLFAWAIVVTSFSSAVHDYASKMPVLSTTSYGVYIFLRFLNLATFAAVTCLVTFVARRRGLRLLVERVVQIAVLISVVGLYLYYAPLVGLPEPPRTRNATQGGEQALLSTYYAFHRAMGTFREPSHFAEWLMAPFCFAFLYTGLKRIISLAFIGTALLLTGSLTGIFGIIGGVVAAGIIVYRGRVTLLKAVPAAAVSIAIVGILFASLVRTYSGKSVRQNANILEVVVDRITPILSDGVSVSNRGYVYDYVRSAPTPLLGAGLGNAGLDFAEAIGSSLPGTFLSMYFNTYYSLGPIGLTILIIFLLAPIARTTLRPFRERKRLFWFLAGYIAMLISHGVHSDEFNFMTALTFAALCFSIDSLDQGGRVGRAKTDRLRRDERFVYPSHRVSIAAYSENRDYSAGPRGRQVATGQGSSQGLSQ